MKYYAGQTENLNRRLLEHNSGKGNYTSKGAPWRMVHCFECASRSEAIHLEKTIKSRGIKRYLQDNNLLK
ncbi:putative endonuclease [Spirosoma fluviale]|uniref:Putative endonuclease n=2 Tax=Spirosoma fluviale TaxID=1597977 RepID=A0A286GKG9_9BACT|nr:putative endonuclease [Spirosoma fluviale]